MEMKTIPEPQLRVFYSRRKSIIISRTEAQMLLQELKKWLEPISERELNKPFPPKVTEWQHDLKLDVTPVK